jgi:hypothetical protein
MAKSSSPPVTGIKHRDREADQPGLDGVQLCVRCQIRRYGVLTVGGQQFLLRLRTASEVRISVGTEDFSRHQNVQTSSAAHPVGTGGGKAARA